jgi:Sulfite exporter TauE/SafE
LIVALYFDAHDDPGERYGVVILFVASFWAGAQNALAGDGSFITLPVLMFTGMDAQAANITSTIALFPAQIGSGWTGRRQVSDAAALSFRVLVAISLVGGALGLGARGDSGEENIHSSEYFDRWHIARTSVSDSDLHVARSVGRHGHRG